jgi:hypothetical protein
VSRQSLEDPALRRFATAMGDCLCAVQMRVLSRQSLKDPALRRFATAMNGRVCCDFLRGGLEVMAGEDHAQVGRVRTCVPLQGCV